MFGYKPKDLSQDQLKRAEQMGERIGNLFNNWNVVSRANAFVTNHRFIVLPTVIIVCLSFILYGLFLDRPNFSYGNIPTTSASIYDDSVQFITDKYQSLLQDYRVRLDSVKVLLERGNLTTEDSLYIAISMKYINNIKK